jgi:hypothetical protein
LSTLALAGTATAMVQRETVPAAEAVFFDPDDIECLGEEVTLTGVVRITVQSTLDRRGILHFRVTSQPRNVKAVGSESGTLWLLRGQTTTAFKGVEDPETGEIAFSNFRFLNVFRVVGRAGEPSSSDHFLVHTTVNANGEVTAQVEHVRSTCR